MDIFRPIISTNFLKYVKIGRLSTTTRMFVPYGIPCVKLDTAGEGVHVQLCKAQFLLPGVGASTRSSMLENKKIVADLLDLRRQDLKVLWFHLPSAFLHEKGLSNKCQQVYLIK